MRSLSISGARRTAVLAGSLVCLTASLAHAGLDSRVAARRTPPADSPQGTSAVVMKASAAVTPAVPQLLHQLTDGDEVGRRAAADALGRTGDTRALTALGQAARMDKSAIVRQAAVAALARFRHPSTVGLLVNASADPSAPVAETAVKALLARHDARAPQALSNALHHPASRVRQVAAESLGQLGDIRARGALVKALKDSNASVREAAADALESLDVDGTGSPGSSLFRSDGLY